MTRAFEDGILVYLHCYPRGTVDFTLAGVLTAEASEESDGIYNLQNHQINYNKI